MTIKDKQERLAKSPLKDGVDIYINRAKVLVLLVFWVMVLIGVIYVFLFQYTSGSSLSGNTEIPLLLQNFSDEIFLVFGAALALMIVFYILVLASHFIYRGPIYRIDDKGLHFMQAENFTVPRSAIHAVSFRHNTGLATTLVVEIWEKDRLLALADRLKLFSGSTVDIKDRSVQISLTEIRRRNKFIAALDALSDRVRY